MITLRQLRDLKGWSQATLAAKLEVSPSSIYNWEAGKTRPRPREMRALERLFNMPVDSIQLAEESESKIAAPLVV